MKKTLIFLLLLPIFYFSNSYSQERNKVIDSLNVIINSTSHHDTTIAVANLELGELLYNTNLDTLKYYCEEAKKIAEKGLKNQHSKQLNISFKKILSRSMSNIGFYYKKLGKLTIAIEYYSNSNQLSIEINDKSSIAGNLNNIGVAHNKLGNFKKALEFFKKSLNLSIEGGDKRGEAYNYNNIAYVYRTKGNNEKALIYFKKCLEIRKEINDKRGIAGTLSNINIIYSLQGDFSKSLEYIEKSIEIQKEIGDSKGLAYNYISLGYIYDNQGNYTKSLESYNKALKLQEKIDDKIGTATSLNNIGYLLQTLGDTINALLMYRKSLKIQESVNNLIGIAISYNNIGSVYESQNKLDIALEYYQKSLAVNLETKLKFGITTSWSNISLTELKMGNIDSALVHAERSFKLSNEIGYPSNIKTSSIQLFRIDVLQKELLKADSMMLKVNEINDQAIFSNFSILSEKNQEKYLKTISSDFMNFYSYALYRKNERPKLIGEACNNAIKNKGLLLKSSTSMRSAILKSGDTILIDNYYSWIQLKKKISKLNSKGKKAELLENKANELERFLVKKSLLFSDFKNIQDLSWKDIQNSLNPKEIAIEFIHFNYWDYKLGQVLEPTTSTIYCAFIITDNCEFPEMIRLFNEKEIESILGKVGGNNINYINRIYGSHKKLNTQLYNLIWEPIERRLKGIKKIYISPSGLLHKVSFSAISNKKGVFLCDNFNIETQSSITNIITPKISIFDQKNKQITAAIFGGIAYDSESSKTKIWNYLEGTMSEAKQINTLLTENKFHTILFSQQGATEAEFKRIAGESDILHIATHGFFYPDPQKIQNITEMETSNFPNISFRGGTTGFGVVNFVTNPNPLMRSGLVFAGANDVWTKKTQNGEDGVLTAQEVAHIDLRKTNLVVLSACETGLGDIVGAEGVYGLQRAFKMAGVKYIVMSLWQVPDKETEEFMVLFYKKLSVNISIREAFNQTQKEMRQKYDPYFWAAFILLE